MTEVFTWTPDSKPTGKITQRTRSVKFGDGYEQVVGDGINAESQSWPLTFSGTKARIQSILAFLRARKGYQSFYWTPPFGAQALFRCSEFDPADQGGGKWILSVTFDQAFAP